MTYVVCGWVQYSTSFLFGDVYNTYLLVEGSSQYPWKAEEHRVAESRVDIRHFKLHMN